IQFFSFWTEALFHMEQNCSGNGGTWSPPGSVIGKIGRQLPCHLTFTTAETGDIIRSNISLSPLYSGEIEGTGPRYCPSIEDKILKFPDKAAHQVFLEPEGVETEEIYVNGLSSSMPIDVQVRVVRSVTGCESAEIVRPAYAVEYDYCPPTQLTHSLETKVC